MKNFLYKSTKFILSSLLLFLMFSNTANIAFAQSIQYSYDSLNRLIEVRYPDKIIHYIYDAAGNRSAVTVESLTAAPSITNINPNAANIGGNGFTLTVNGSNFTNNSVVQWNGVARPTSFDSATQLTATISPGDISALGTFPITVLNPTNNISNSQLFTVQSGTANCIPVSIANNLTAATSSTVSIPVMVDNLTNRGIDSYDFILSFNSNVIRPVSATPVDTTGTLSSGMNVTANTSVAGKLQIGAFGTSSLSGSGTLLKLNFEVIGAEGTNSALTWTQFQFNEGDPCASLSNGLISVSGASYTISGTVTYGTTPANQATKFVSGVTLTGAGSPQVSAATNSSGNYQLSGFGSGGYIVTPSKTGDVNGITSFDASLVARKAASLISLTPNQLIAADVSNNGSVSSFDASLIARTAAGIANTGIAGQWKFVPAMKDYQTVTSNLTTENYEAVLMGEVSGNWSAPVIASRESKLTEEQQKEADRREEQEYQQTQRLFGLNQTADILSKNSFRLNSDEQTSPELAGIQVSLPPDATGSAGTTISVPVTVGDTTGQDIFGFDFTVSFDPDVLELASPAFDTTGTLAGAAGFTITPNTSTPGKITISGFGTQPLTGSGVLIYLRFTVKSSSKFMTDLTFDSFIFNEGEPSAKTTDGRFTRPTAAQVTITGRVLSEKGSRVKLEGTRAVGVARATVTLTDAEGNVRTVATDTEGYYRFEAVAVGQIYVIEVRATRRIFAPQVITVNGSIDNLNFVAAP